MKGYEIYITPIHDELHYLVIDDLSPVALIALIAAGYQPALVQESSMKDDEINYQAVLIVHKIKHEQEQSIANKLVMKLNQTYGDKKFSGVVHAFRLAGFSNKKRGKNDFFTKPTIQTGIACRKANDELNMLRESYISMPKPGKKIKIESQTANLDSVDADDVVIKAFLFNFENELRRARERGDEINHSKLDFRVVKNMRGMGFTDAQISAGLVFGSPNISDRHPDVMDYVTRTLNASR
jgi:hypothetical protein